MTDRWYFTHSGRTYGPVMGERLRQLAREARLHRTDLVWSQETTPQAALPAEAMLSFPASIVSTGEAIPPKAWHAPSWLDDIDANEEAQAESAVPQPPEWLEDVAALNRYTDPLAAHPSTLKITPSELAAAPVEKPLAITIGAPTQPLEPPTYASLQPLGAKVEALASMTFGAATSAGRVRDENEDSLFALGGTWSKHDRAGEWLAAVVADGMGGHNAGDVASRLAIAAMAKVFAASLTQQLDGIPGAASEILGRAFQDAHTLVSDAARKDVAFLNMGSTAVALLIQDREACIGLVGDCRAYHFNAGKLTRVTRDQSIVARMVELGQLTPEEAAEHPLRNQVTQAIGVKSNPRPAFSNLTLASGDWLLLVSDGIYGHVDDGAIAAAIRQETSARRLACRLVDLANEGGGSDNSTVIAIRCE